jgi:hypothetical protein
LETDEITRAKPNRTSNLPSLSQWENYWVFCVVEASDFEFKLPGSISIAEFQQVFTNCVLLDFGKFA